MSTPKNRKGFTDDWFIIQKKTINKAIGAVIVLLLFVGGAYAVKKWIDNREIRGELDEKAAKFGNIEGNVTVKRQGEAAESANLKMALKQGDTIQTGSGATAIIVYSDSTRYTLKPGSTFILTENAPEQKRVVNELQGGGVSVKTEENSSNHYIKSKNVKVEVGQSAGSTINNENDKTTVVVTGGLAKLLFGDGTEQIVKEDQVAEIEKTDVKVTDLPAPPKLSKPESTKELLLERTKPEVDFVWAPIPSAESYTLEISTTMAFTQQAIKLRVADIKETKYKWSNPLSGQVFWRVQALIKDKQIQTKWSEPSTASIKIKGGKIDIELTKQKEVAPLLWEIEGNTAPGARLRINNQQVAVDSNGHFKKDLALAPNQKEIILEASDPSGNSGRRVVKL